MEAKNKFTLSHKDRHLFTRDSHFTVVKKENGMQTLKGYPITFNTLSDDRGGYKVRIMPGSVALAAQVFAVCNHNYDQPLAVTDNNSLRILPADDKGIPVEIDLPDVSYARDMQTLIADKIVKGMSFAAIPETVKSHETTENGQRIVNFDSFTTDEFTVTAIPSFVSTTIDIAPPAASPSGEEKKNAAMRLCKLEREQTIRLQRLRLDVLNI